MNWRGVKDEPSPQNRPLDTKIDDEHGVRNEQKLMRRGNFWWLPDGSMYVYYTPTHWREPNLDR